MTSASATAPKRALAARKLAVHPDRLFPTDPTVRALARTLYRGVCDLPIISPHGHTDPAWFAYDKPFTNATELLLAPDHYLFRMLYSQGVSLRDLGVPSRQGPVGDRPAGGVATVRAPLPSLQRHAVGHVAQLRVRADLRPGRAARRGIGRSLLRHDRREAATRVSSARARSSSASTSKCSPPPNRPSTRWNIIG